MLRAAFEMNPALSDAYRYILFLDRYRSGDYQNALLEASQIDLPRDIFSPVSLAMVHGALGDQSAQEEVLHQLREPDLRRSHGVLAGSWPAKCSNRSATMLISSGTADRYM